MKIQLPNIGNLWKMTRFSNRDLSNYAEELVVVDARKGILALSVLSVFLLCGVGALYAWLGYDMSYVYTCMLLALLALHIAISVRFVRETGVLYLLGTTLLVVCGLGFMLLAHKSGNFETPTYAAVVLLFMVVPLVPWGLREALSVISMVYLLFTASTLTVQGRFDTQTLLNLQFLMLAAGMTTLIVIARSVAVRKHDIESRYELEKARENLERLSFKDPLTDAWNRRYLDQNFSAIAERFHQADGGLHFALVDVDDFKALNDAHGHLFGDLVLRRLVAVFGKCIGPEGHLARMGGDEFALLFQSEDPEALVSEGLQALQCDPVLVATAGSARVSGSVGSVSVREGRRVDLDILYREADRALYEAKTRSKRGGDGSHVVSRAIESGVAA